MTKSITEDWIQSTYREGDIIKEKRQKINYSFEIGEENGWM